LPVRLEEYHRLFASLFAVAVCSMKPRVDAPGIDALGIAPLAIGITGHRLERLAESGSATLAFRIAEVIDVIERAAPGEHFRLVGSLAEGADTIAADAALSRGWQLDTVLPFSRANYSNDFDQAGAADLNARLRASTNVFELPGSRDELGGEGAAYERAGRVVLTQSDILLAVWDGDPPRGRGGTAQIVAEAVAHAVPVVVIHPDQIHAPVLLWSGLNDHDGGLEAVDTVARGSLADLPQLMSGLSATKLSQTQSERARRRRSTPPAFAIAYPLLLALTGVRRFRSSDLRRPCPAVRATPSETATALQTRIDDQLWPSFDKADCEASLAAQMFRSAFVSSFALAALAVTMSLLGLIVPAAVRPLLAAGEFSSILLILIITRWGSRAGWHDRWLDQRMLAEELRCLAVSASFGDLFLRGARTQERDGSGRERRHIARRIGLPSARVDAAYLADAHRHLVALLDDQIGYVRREADRMHRLEHRLHRLGGVLFAISAIVCAGVLGVESFGALLAHESHGEHGLPLGVTVISASLPAIGAAVYGIRMQGDFAGSAERNAALAKQLDLLRKIAQEAAPNFDDLRRLIRRTGELLTADVSQWARSTRARPLSLPG
jgi:hypothetical protein